MNLPNILTLSRVAMIPLLALLILVDTPYSHGAALVLYVIAALTDFLDGYIARRRQEFSSLGRMLDPVADKLLVGMLLILFSYNGSFDISLAIAAILIMLREIAVSGLREFLGGQNINVHVSRAAKYKTTVQLLALGAVMAKPILPQLDVVAVALMWIATGLTLYTGYDYFYKALPHLQSEA